VARRKSLKFAADEAMEQVHPKTKPWTLHLAPWTLNP